MTQRLGSSSGGAWVGFGGITENETIHIGMALWKNQRMAGPDRGQPSGTFHQRSSLCFRSVPGAAAGRVRQGRGRPSPRTDRQEVTRVRARR